jgi:glycosyltransferase involved in cell wall biosynthesis
MRIDLAITELDVGGAERCCAELALFLKSQRHSVRVISIGPRPTGPKADLVRSLEDAAIDIHFLGARKSWMLPMVIWRERQLFRQDRPDLIQSFLWHANVLSALVAPTFRIPLVGGIRVAEPRRSRHRLGAWAARRMDRVVCVSSGVARWCAEFERVDKDKIVVIPNGVAAHAVRSLITDSPVPGDAKVLLFVGRLEAQKGIDVLVTHAPKLLEKLSDHHLVVIGEGSMKGQMLSLASTPELNGRVHVLGQRNDVRAWMQRASLLLLPTRYEGMPNVVLEAMAEGLVVVTTRVEGIEEVLTEELQEQIVAPGEWQAFFAKASSLALDPSRRRALSAMNRSRVEAAFELRQQLGKYEELYRSILSK